MITGCLVLGPLLSGAASSDMQRGRYRVRIGGCNDCHTASYAESGGAVADRGAVGFKRQWGITYAPNLRLLLQGNERGRVDTTRWSDGPATHALVQLARYD